MSHCRSDLVSSSFRSFRPQRTPGDARKRGCGRGCSRGACAHRVGVSRRSVQVRLAWEGSREADVDEEVACSSEQAASARALLPPPRLLLTSRSCHTRQCSPLARPARRKLKRDVHEQPVRKPAAAGGKRIATAGLKRQHARAHEGRSRVRTEDKDYVGGAHFVGVDLVGRLGALTGWRR